MKIRISHCSIYLGLILALCMVSCGSRKKTYAYSSNEERLERIENILNRQQEVISTWTDKSELFENVEIIEREFDISSGTDSSGNYPVVREIITKKESGKKNDVKGVVEEKENENSSYIEDQKSDIVQEYDVKEEKKESRTFMFISWIILLFLVIGVVLYLKIPKK